MNNTLPSRYNYPSTCITPTVAVIGIITFGICWCYTTNKFTKPGRSIELKYKDFSLTSYPPVPISTVVA